MSAEIRMTPSETLAWDAVQGLQSFRIADVRQAGSVSKPTATEYVAAWARHGLIKVAGRDALGNIYELIEVVDLPSPPLGGTAHGNMWRAARMIGEFSALDLAVHSCTEDVAVDEKLAGEYCTALLAAGYLRVTQKAIPGRRVARYRLIRNAGALPPIVRRVKALVDPNVQQTVVIGRVS